MKDFFIFIISILYKYYDKGSTKDIAYEKSLLSISALLFLIITDILIALGIDLTKVYPVTESYGKFVKFLGAALITLPYYIALRLLIKEKDLCNKTYSRCIIMIGNISLIVTIISSFIIFVLLIKSRMK
jgi:hypothetical protein